MRVVDSAVQLGSTHVQQETTTFQASIEVRPVTAPALPARPAAPAEPAAPAVPSAAPQLSPRDEIALLVLAKTFGIRLDPAGAAAGEDAARARAATPATPALPATPAVRPSRAAGVAIQVDAVETRTASEATTFSAAAHVTTADGRTLDAVALLAMERVEVSRQEVHLRAGAAAPAGGAAPGAGSAVDPLVLNLDGRPAAFAGTAPLDLDGDGAAEEVPRLTPGSSYLALDRDGSGAIDSGAELFGPSTGSGFGELAALDQDGNGWVDEGDAAFTQLVLWNPATGAPGSLRAAGVGALYTGAVATPFEVRDAAGAAQARVAQTGLFLCEDGSAGTVQHVDLIA